MNATHHLDDARLMALAAGDAESDVEATHLASCPVCRADREAFSRVRTLGAGASTPFATARAERDLMRVIDGEQRAQKRAWRPAAVLGAVLLSAAAGAVGASLVAAPEPQVALQAARTGGAAVARPSAGPAPAPVASLSVPAPAPSPAPSLLQGPVGLALGNPVKPPRRVSAGTLPEAGATTQQEASRLVLALSRGDAVEPALLAVLARDPTALVAIDDDLVRIGSAFALRVRCERGLLTRRDRHTVEACRTFARSFPADPAVRTLAFAAGRVAEDELGDPALAEEEYGRALLLSPFAGVSSTDALLARARVRSQQGEVDEARADLRLYLSSEPAARHDPAVVELARSLNLVP